MKVNLIDVTSLCLSTAGIVLLVVYLAFLQSVTRKGDFYQVRRWKVASWVAAISGVVLFAVLFAPSITTIFNNSSSTHPIDLLEALIVVILTAFTYVIPMVFVVMIGMYLHFKWWRNSDHILDKIWEDPHKGHKSPIQDL